MKLYDGGRAPNPRRVRMFLAEKSIEVPMVIVDMGAMGHKADEISSRNPLQRLPVLELDDGTILTETVAICRYFEELQPEPALFGRDALGKAQVEMWNRRLELNYFYAVAAVFRHIHPAMKEWEVPQVPEWGEANKPKMLDFLRLFNAHLADSRYAAGDEFSIADITGFVALDFMRLTRVAVPSELVHVLRWRDLISARPSAQA